MGCENLINTCGKISFGKCVRFQGTLHKETKLNACDDLNVDQVISDISSELDDINSELDLSALGNKCVSYTKVNDTILAKNAFIAIEDKLCKLQTYTGMTDSNCPSCPQECSPVFNLPIACLNLNLGNLVTACGTQPTTLKDLLQVILTKIGS